MVLYTLALTLACLVAVAVVVGAELGQRRGNSSRAFTVTLISLAAFCATLSTVSYAMAGSENEYLVPLVIGDITMPLSIGLLWAGLRRSEGKRPSLAHLAVAGSLIVGTVTLAGSPEAGQTAKLFASALFCALCVVECTRGGLPKKTARLIGVGTGVYGAYCLLRSAHSSADQVAGPVVGTGPSFLVAAICLAVVTVGVVFLFRAMPGGRRVSATTGIHGFRRDVRNALSRGGAPVRVLVVSIPDFVLQRAAFGLMWSRSLEDALLEAVASVTPPETVFGPIARGAIIALPADAAPDAARAGAGHNEAVQHAFIQALAGARPSDVPDLVVQHVNLRDAAQIAGLARDLRQRMRRDPYAHSPALKGA